MGSCNLKKGVTNETSGALSFEAKLIISKSSLGTLINSILGFFWEKHKIEIISINKERIEGLFLISSSLLIYSLIIVLNVLIFVLTAHMGF